MIVVVAVLSVFSASKLPPLVPPMLKVSLVSPCLYSSSVRLSSSSVLPVVDPTGMVILPTTTPALFLTSTSKALPFTGLPTVALTSILPPSVTLAVELSVTTVASLSSVIVVVAVLSVSKLS